MNKFNVFLLAILSSVLAPSAFAAVDVSSVVTEISSNISSVTSIGSAVLLIIVAVAGFRWIRSAIR